MAGVRRIGGRILEDDEDFHGLLPLPNINRDARFPKPLENRVDDADNDRLRVVCDMIRRLFRGLLAFVDWSRCHAHLAPTRPLIFSRSEEHTSELQSRQYL